MKIVIATPILYNATSPFNHLFKDIIGGFLENGHEVIRLVAVEDKNETDFKYGYDGKKIQYKLFKRKNSDHGDIVSRYIRDTLTNIKEARAIRKLKDVDVLFEDVSYSSFWAVRAAKKKGIKVVAMLQDVWPDNAVQSHLISKDTFLYKYFEMWQKYVYKHADRIICISDDMKQFIASKGIDENKIDVIYNWGYSDEIVDIAWKKNKFVEKYNLDNNIFYAVYAGNIGKMQNVEIVVNAAKRLKNREDIHFLIVGDGVRRQAIEEMAKDMKNVTMLPMQPSDIATHIYSAAGVNIIPLVAGGMKIAMPSKTGVVLSCGKPSIYTYGADSRFAQMVTENGVGYSVNADDSTALAECILKIKEDSSFNTENVHLMFKELFARSKGIQKYSEIVEKVK